MAKNPRVLLLSMPWTSLVEPSLGLGILKSVLYKKNIECRIVHLNIFLLKYMRATTYISIANIFAINEFLFTYIFEKNISNEQYKALLLRIDEIIENNLFVGDERYNDKDSIIQLFQTLRTKIIPEYLHDCLKFIADYNPTMIGFTCMFDQTIASVALSKLVKERFPNILIVFGGYALKGDPGFEILKSFNCVDCIAYDEGEGKIEKLALASVNKFNLSDIPNVLYRSQGKIHTSNTADVFIDLNDSPFPNYNDFYNDLKELFETHSIKIKWRTLPVETSRGCWWGQKSHCIFCGIDESSLKYRQRNVKTTLKMLSVLSNKYNSIYFRISDYILPYKYYSLLLPELSKLNPNYIFTCEIKSNISYKQFIDLKSAGFIEVQPGIETFSSSILKKMNKGVNAIQNIYCLILGFYNSVNVNYNILYGFPNDTLNEYQNLLKTIPYLYHLYPPSSRVRVAVTRFSPLHMDPKRFEYDSVYEHNKCYDVLFSNSFIKKTNFNIDNYCYYFENPFFNRQEIEYLYKLLIYQIDYWRNIHQTREVYLKYEVYDDKIIFYDTRYSVEPQIKEYNNIYKIIYEECSPQMITKEQLFSKLKFFSKSSITVALEQLFNDRFIFIEDSKIVGLAFKEQVYINFHKEQNKWLNINKASDE